MRLTRWASCLAVVTVALTACSTPATTSRQSTGTSVQGAGTAQARTLTILARYEVADLAPKIPGGSSPIVTKRLFNAFPALIDSVGNARPYLLEALPQVN